jgi:hypothetical protein
MSITGACVFAGNNSRWKGNSYRLNGTLIGFEKLVKLEPARFEVPGHADRMRYTIKPINGTPEFDVVSVIAKKIGASPVDTWDPKDLTKLLPGKMKWEYRINTEGGFVTRSDSTSVFEATGKGLADFYPGSQKLEFANVHDDAAEGGSQSDSLRNFMDEMRSIKGNLDFFAYAGHGCGSCLPSACLYKKSPEYTEFIDILRRVLRPEGTVVFYACSTGVSSGFAQKVSEDIPNATVFGHQSAGHGQTNPEKARFYNGRRETFQELLGADYARWAIHIKSGSDIWRRYAWMDVDEIRQEVQTNVPVLPKKKHKKKAA